MKNVNVRENHSQIGVRTYLRRCALRRASLGGRQLRAPELPLVHVEDPPKQIVEHTLRQAMRLSPRTRRGSHESNGE